jgi:hypothetical protein
MHAMRVALAESAPLAGLISVARWIQRASMRSQRWIAAH